MPERATLVVDVRAYWHAGTGRGSGSHLDAVVARDPEGLPLLPGRTLKGLLRDATARALAWGWFDDLGVRDAEPDAVSQLFGPPVQIEADGRRPRGGCGLLRISDARLPERTRSAFRAGRASPRSGGRDPAAGLYRALFATAIDPDTGTPLEHALRGMEVAVPLRLEAQVTLHPSAAWRDLADRWHALLERALPLVRAVGAHRSRGLGRAVLRLEAVA